MRKEHHFHLSIFASKCSLSWSSALKIPFRKILFYKYTNFFWVGKASMFPNLPKSFHQNEAFLCSGITSTPIPCVDRGLAPQTNLDLIVNTNSPNLETKSILC
jgi:hypothetical protein